MLIVYLRDRFIVRIISQIRSAIQLLFDWGTLPSDRSVDAIDIGHAALGELRNNTNRSRNSIQSSPYTWSIDLLS